jgi:CheY-like chemotaxis protein
MTDPTPHSYAWRPPSSEGPSKTLLLVEDEPATQRFYLTGVKGLPGWQCLPAGNGQEALDLLRKQTVDVLVTDLNMPVMDGYRLITAVHGLYPLLPVIVLTSLPEGEPQDRARHLGALRVLSKPVRLSLLMDEIKFQANREAPGQVKGLSLGSLLQLMIWESKTCTITVKGQGHIGHLYVQMGQLIHAINETDEGLLAAYQILSWENPQVEFVDTCQVEPTIALPTQEVLMQLAVMRDHQSEGAPKTREDVWGQF